MYLRSQVKRGFYYISIICRLTIVPFTSLLAMCLVSHFRYIISSTFCEIGVITFTHKRERRLRQMNSVPKVTARKLAQI